MARNILTWVNKLVVSTDIGLLIQNWRRVKREYWFVVIETLIALALFNQEQGFGTGAAMYRAANGAVDLQRGAGIACPEMG